MTTAINAVTNDAADVISFEEPYVVRIKIRGTSPFLFHRWNVDAVEAKGKAAKGSKAKKEDDLESYVYRDTSGALAVPSEYFRMSAIHAAKFRQDPRSPRKSAMDLFKAGIVCLDELASIGKKEWDFVDRRRVTIQRSGITRCRPALSKGYEAEFHVQVLLPEYISSELLNEIFQMSGRLVGVGDFRPTFGRFQVTAFDTI